MENSEIKKQDKKTKTLKTHHCAEANHRAEPITGADIRRYRQRYFGLLESELHEPEFEYMERAQAGLPEGRLSAATEVAVATPNLIRGLDETTEPGDLWTPNLCGDGFDRALPEEQRILRVRQFGQFWYPQRMS